MRAWTDREGPGEQVEQAMQGCAGQWAGRGSQERGSGQSLKGSKWEDKVLSGAGKGVGRKTSSKVKGILR